MARKLLRLIIPAYPSFNIYSRIASKTTALGPILVASAANKLPGWEVEVIDENNCHNRPAWLKLAPDGHIDHQILQQERPAAMVGFYASLSSTIPRVFELAKIYQSLGVLTIAGGYHVRSLPDEALANYIDVVAMDGGEKVIIELMQAYDLIKSDQEGPEASAEMAMADPLAKHEDNPYWFTVADISFRYGGKTVTNPPRALQINCQPNPLPDFSLLRYARIKVYPIKWHSGCPYQCKFCAVKEKPTREPAEDLLDTIKYCFEKFGAKKFFIVDDHFGGNLKNRKDRNETLRALELLTNYQKQIGQRLSFTVQIRLSASRDWKLMSAMRAAGIDLVCIGYESLFNDELRAMNKGYVSAGSKHDAEADMIKDTWRYHQHGFFIHGMFIFGYPVKAGESLPIKPMERAKTLRDFIRKTKLDTLQVLFCVPLPGTELREELITEGRLYPGLGWEYHDGQFPVFDPGEGKTPEELQAAVEYLMASFYSWRRLPRLIFNILVHFPRVIFPSILSLLGLRVDAIKSAFIKWRRNYFRNDPIRFGGWFVVKNWRKKYRTSDFPDKLKRAQVALKK